MALPCIPRPSRHLLQHQPRHQACCARLRRHLLTLPAAWLLLPPAVAAPTEPAGPSTSRLRAPSDQAKDTAVRQSRARLDRLYALTSAAFNAGRIAANLVEKLQALAARHQAAQASAAPAQAALQALARQALPVLQDRQDAWQQAGQAADDAVVAHQAAVQQLLDALPAGRGAAMDHLDTAAEHRRTAEAAEAAARQALDSALADAGRGVGLLVAHWQDVASPIAANQAALRSAAVDWTALQQRWQALRQDAQAAGVTSPAWPALAPAVPWDVPADTAAPLPPDGTLVQAAQRALAASAAAGQALWMLADAQAAVQQALADSGCSTGPDGRPAAATPGATCGSWQADAEQRRSDSLQQKAAAVRALADQRRAGASLLRLPENAGASLQALLARHADLAAAVAQASGPALRSLRAAIDSSAVSTDRLDQAREQAVRIWVEAMRAKYGKGWDDLPPPGAGPPGPPARAVSPSPTASMRPPIDSHALHRLRQRNDEPPGFAAYTYVLVGTGVSPATPGVHARLQRLLDALRNLPQASSFSSDERARLNTFVVPVPAASSERDALVVDLPLAQSLLTHLPPALRLADATRRQLLLDNGPFLVTLPGPLAQARSDWPLLFANLSQTPEAVVTDVARRYMADLIGTFNPASTDWQPPAGMQVAITLVRLVKGSGDVVQAVFGGAGR